MISQHSSHGRCRKSEVLSFNYPYSSLSCFALMSICHFVLWIANPVSLGAVLHVYFKVVDTLLIWGILRPDGWNGPVFIDPALKYYALPLMSSALSSLQPRQKPYTLPLMLYFLLDRKWASAMPFLNFSLFVDSLLFYSAFAQFLDPFSIRNVSTTESICL